MERTPPQADFVGVGLFRVAGIEIRLDWTWFFLAALILWTLAAGYFPENYPGQTSQTYWTMGALGTLGLFFSIIVHELCHSLVGRHYGMRISSIRLFIFGGVAEMQEEPESAKTESLMALAGPAASFVIGIIFGMIAAYAMRIEASVPTMAILNYLGGMNLLLAVFNMLPAFPLDGGRILRAGLWRWKKDIRWATKVASRIGAGFGFAFIALGIVGLYQGAVVGGIWMALIGFFLQSISHMSYQTLLLKKIFEGEPLGRFVPNQPVTVAPEITLKELVDKYFYSSYHKVYPVVADGQLLGAINLEDVGRLGRERWNDTLVADLMVPATDANTMDEAADVSSALNKMRRGGNTRMMVVDHDNPNRLIGVVSLADLLKVFTVESMAEGAKG